MSARDGAAVAVFDPAAHEARLRERCAELVELARRHGAEEAEAYAQSSDQIGVTFEKADLKLAQVDEGASYGVRVFRDGRLGFAATNQGSRESLEEAARDACRLAAFNPPDAHNRLPAPRPLGPDLRLASEELCALEIDDVVERGREWIAMCTEPDPRISLDLGSLSLSRGARCVASTAGVEAAESDALVSFSTFGMAVDGDDVSGFHYSGGCVRDLLRLGARLEVSALEFTSTVLGNLGAQKAESYRGPVLFSPAALLDVFVRPLVGAASAIAVQRGRSYLAGKLGAPVASAALSIYDDPTDAELGGAGRFDREGEPCGRFGVVEEGRLASYLYNAYAAAVEGRASTGHAAGGARSVPGVGVHAIDVPGGTRARAELARTLGRGLFVQRFSGTVDPASGDFSGVAKSARWLEDGHPVRSLRETLISGNAFGLLAGDLSLSSERELVGSSARAPYALVDGVDVTAG